MKKVILFLVFFVVIGIIAFKVKPVKHIVAAVLDKTSLINKDSITIKSRINTPEGYKRVDYAKGSFSEYLRNFKLKPFGAKL